MTPHTALRTVEAKIRDMRTYIRSDDPVWTAIDDLWELVILGKKEE